MSFYITKKTRHWSIFCKNRHSLKQKSGTDWKKQELIKKIKIKRYRVEDLEEEKNWHIYGCSVTQAVFSPSAALCQLIKTGNIFLSCVREAQLSCSGTWVRNVCFLPSFHWVQAQSFTKTEWFWKWLERFILSDRWKVSEIRKVCLCEHAHMRICVCAHPRLHTCIWWGGCQ